MAEGSGVVALGAGWMDVVGVPAVDVFFAACGCRIQTIRNCMEDGQKVQYAAVRAAESS